MAVTKLLLGRSIWAECADWYNGIWALISNVLLAIAPPLHRQSA